MASKSYNDAKNHFDSLARVVEHHGLPSDEARHHYNEIRACYSKAPTSEQQLFAPLIEQADKHWAQLEANQRKRNAPYTLIDESNREHEVWDVAIDDDALTVEFSASFTKMPSQLCQLRRNKDKKTVPIFIGGHTVTNARARWSAEIPVR
jgi:hypothetical protein